MTATDRATVLIADDEREVADAYAAQLSTRYDVRTVYSGKDALTALNPEVDVMLFDGQMSDVTGREVVDAIREHGLNTRAAMVTGIDPEFDIIDVPFDDYVVKPADRTDLFDTIGRLVTCIAYEAHIREYYALTSKYATLRTTRTETELANSEEFRALEADLKRHRSELDRIVDSFDDDDFEVLLRDFGGTVPPASDIE